MFEKVAAALARLVARLRAASPGVRPREVDRALREDVAPRERRVASDDDTAGTAARARAAAAAARRAREERKEGR